MARLLTIVLSAVWWAIGSLPVNAQSFPNELKVTLLRDGTNIQLLSDFIFVDKQRRTWKAPKDSISDGASIPWPLWSIVGSPLSGKYREAAVLHDHYTAIKTRPWEQVDKMFHDAMLANGVNTFQANLFYLAVLRFGPKWGFNLAGYCLPGARCLPPPPGARPTWSCDVESFSPIYTERDVATIEAALRRERFEELEQTLALAVRIDAEQTIYRTWQPSRTLKPKSDADKVAGPGLKAVCSPL